MSGNGTELVINKEIFEGQPSDMNAAPTGLGIGFVNWLAGAGPTMPPWWSTAREQRLRQFYKDSDHLSGTVYTFRSIMTSIPFKVMPRDRTVKSHVKQAEDFQVKLENDTVSRNNFTARGWLFGYGPFIHDIVTQDNGGFMAIDGPGRADGPLTGPATRLIHLDSFRCQRTGSEEFPVIYTDTDGKRFKLHQSRVIAISSMSSPIAEMYGVGFCAVSRAIHTAQSLMDNAQYKEEKLGSRPRRGLGVVEGARPKEVDAISSALSIADESLDNRGLSRYSMFPIIGLKDGATFTLIDFASIPDGFNNLEDTQLGMSVLALAFGVSTRTLSFAIGVAGQTRADAQVQQEIMQGKGPAEIIQQVEQQIEDKFLPPQLKIAFDFQDDGQDERVADIRNKRSERHERDVNTGIITLRVAREQMLEDGDLTREQFIQLELDDGRQESGEKLEVLFQSTDKTIQELIAGITEQSTPEEIEEQRQVVLTRMQTAQNANIKNKAQMVLALLDSLKPEEEEIIGEIEPEPEIEEEAEELEEE